MLKKRDVPLRKLVPGAMLLAVFLPCREVRADQVLTLGQAIERGRHYAPEVRAARAAAGSEDAQYASAVAGYYPTLTASVAGEVQSTRTTQPLEPPKVGLFPFVSSSTVGQGTATMSWTAWDFGKTLNAVRNARAQRTNAILTTAATDLTVVTNVANGYLTLAFAEKLRDVAAATVAEREKLVAIGRGLVDAGLQPALEQFRSEARAEGSRRDLASAEAAVVDARVVLNMLIGYQPDEPIVVRIPNLSAPPNDTNRAMLEAAHLASVGALEATVDQYEAAVGAAKAQYLPTLGLSASGYYSLTQYNDVAGLENTRGASAIVTLTETIFNIGLASAVDAQKANVENAAWTAEVARRNSREEAARATAALSSAATMLEHARKAAVGAAAVLAVVQERYVKGLSSPLELIEAESADDDARLAEAQDEMNYAMQIVRLYVDTGRKIPE